jgi:hypothetical protein
VTEVTEVTDDRRSKEDFEFRLPAGRQELSISDLVHELQLASLPAKAGQAVRKERYAPENASLSYIN